MMDGSGSEGEDDGMYLALCVPNSLCAPTLGFVIAGELNARFGISFCIELERTLSVLAVMLAYPTAVTSIPLLGAIIEKTCSS